MRKKLKIGVLMGGPSSEHDISMLTGRNVIDNLDRKKYEPFGIRITKDREWFIRGRKMSEAKALAECDLVFNALHGSFGEDGQAQSIMEYHGARYTGSGVCGSALAMDKLRSRDIFKLAGLAVPKTLKIRKGENYQAVLNLFCSKIVGYPVVIKPCSSGSSVGVQIVKSQKELDKVVKASLKSHGKILIEEFIEGREVTCGVLENFGGQTVSALPVTEIIPKKNNKFFNYDAKYKNGHSEEITPAFLSEELTKKIQDIAIQAHQVLGCKAYSRTDMIIRNVKQNQLEFGNNPKDYDNIYVLETNTLPGLTPASLFPKAAQAVGLTLSQLLDKIIESSLA
jgi:D-alanine-D-alanine ligase